MMIKNIDPCNKDIEVFQTSDLTHKIFYTVIIVLFFITGNFVYADLRNVDQEFDPEGVFKILELKFPSVEWINKQTGAELAWHESYRIMAYLAMFEGTLDTSYISKAIHRIDAILNKRDDKMGVIDEVRNRIMPAWSSTIYTNGIHYVWIVHAGMITYPIIRCVYLILHNQDLLNTYNEKAAEYISAVRETVDGFESSWREDKSTGEGWYYADYHRRGAPLNQQNALGRTLVLLWLTTGNSEYRSKAQKLAVYFKKCLMEKDDTYLWLSWGHYGKIVDISHAAISVDFSYLCCNAGLVFSNDDMKYFVNTFKNCIREDGFSEFINGKGDLSLSVEMGRWAHLCFINPNIRQYLVNYFSKNWLKNYRTTYLAIAYLVETQNIKK